MGLESSARALLFLAFVCVSIQAFDFNIILLSYKNGFWFGSVIPLVLGNNSYMKIEFLSHFVSPVSRRPLEIGHIEEEEFGEIKTGELVVRDTKERYDIKNFIPRFVTPDNYAASFGKQWNRYKQVQIDRFNGLTITADRFYKGTQWSKEELNGERILEVGCGAGRFTQIMLDAGAIVYSGDFSAAVDANWSNNGPHPRLNLFQGDIYQLPLPYNFFDKVFCYGVLQHTPDVKQAFMSLVPFLRSGGKIAIDVYKQPQRWPSRWSCKNVWRPITTRLSHNVTFRVIEWYVPRWIPIDNWIERHAPYRIKRLINGLIPCYNYTRASWAKEMNPDQIKQWAILDTFDALTPKYDQPQEASEVESWFREADLRDSYVGPGEHGFIKGNARRFQSPSAK